MIDKNVELTKDKHISYFVDSFCGALGLTMNIQADHYIINDFDKNKANLYFWIKFHPMKLIKILLEIDLDAEEFFKYKGHKAVLSQEGNDELIPDIREAAIYLFRTSCYA